MQFSECIKVFNIVNLNNGNSGRFSECNKYISGNNHKSFNNKELSFREVLDREIHKKNNI